MTDHSHFMQIACSLARHQLGQTWPNPSVGAVLVQDGHIISEAATARGGRPHAETIAIAQAGRRTKGATLYVTLEPCSHQGKTGPCSQSIIDAGIATCVIACSDPNPLVNGQGIAQLKQAGIEVIEGICAEEARVINRGFFSVIQKKRPFISLKLATSLDGKIATANGESKWITSESARREVHRLRAQYDAIATGIGTVLADDPLLTCRLPGMEDRSPIRIVFDRQNRLQENSRLVKTATQIPVWHISNTPSPALQKAGVQCLPYQDSLLATLELIAHWGISRLFVECGPILATSFLNNNLVDRLYWFRAPIILGGDARNVVENGFGTTLSQLARFEHIGQSAFPPDQLDIYEPCSPASSAL